MCSKARCARPADGSASPAQLIEAETGAHLWADRFDGSLEDMFELQDKVAISVAGVIEPALQAAEIRALGATGRPAILTAYDLYLRALRYLCFGDEAQGFPEALTCSSRRSSAIRSTGGDRLAALCCCRAAFQRSERK